MKTKLMSVAITVIAMALFAENEAPKTIKVVGLEDDKDNATVVAPAELGTTKPVVSADALVSSAKAATVQADDLAEAGANVNTANVKSLTLEGMVIPPSDKMVKTLEEAVLNIIAQAGKQIGTVSSNGVEKLSDKPYQQLGDGKSSEIEWRKALRLLLSPVGYNFTEDDEFVLFGLAGEVDLKHRQLAQERLTSNRTPILFTTSESEGGLELRNAIRDVSLKAGVTITTDYMEPSDLYVPVQTAVAEGKMTPEDIGKAKQKASAQQTQIKRTKFDTNGQQIEWRTVLREILNPHDYDFVEMGGVVRIAKRSKLAQWEQEKIAQKPLSAKVIRLYHADPEQVVERVMKIKGLLMHPNASLQATRKKDDNTSTVKNLNARIQTSSGQQSGMSDTTSQVFDKLVRPRTVPAIIAYDVEENMANIEAKIKLFDVKEKQILIEAIIFQLDMNNGNGDMDGIQWTLPGEGDVNFVPLYGSFGNVGNASASFADLLAKGGTDLVDNNRVWMRTSGLDFKATIQLIRRQENSKVLASPMLVIGDHSEAAIQVSDVMPILEVEINTTSNTSTTRDYNYKWNMVRSGTLMWVCPEITEDGKSVRLTVHPQVVDRMPESVKAYVENIGMVENYELKMHEMDTRATVPSGATLLFGGLISNEEAEKENKVRWLGDIPVLGWLFRSKVKTIVQNNLVIMIRPTILEDGDQTGFETNALKEVEDYSANTGRDMRKVPLSGPNSVKEIRKDVKELYDERVVKPFDGWNDPIESVKPGKPEETEEAPRPQEQPASDAQTSQTSRRKRGLFYAFD